MRKEEPERMEGKNKEMECVSCLSSVTQGSVLGLLLLSCISRLLPTLLQLRNLYQHQYAEPALYDHSIDCLQVVPDNLLLLNQMKTEVIVCGTRGQNIYMLGEVEVTGCYS